MWSKVAQRAVRCPSLHRTNLNIFRQCSAAASQRRQDVFYDEQVQSLLKSLTGRDHDKIFRTRRVGRTVSERPTFQFVTDEELRALQEEAERKADMKLDMPPVMDERLPCGQILEQDPLLAGIDVSKHVFTDITYGIPERERLMVVRDVDGTLRTADWEEKDRINQIYYPREGRQHYVAPMFEPDQLSSLLAQPEPRYEYLLDRNCLQFEPDHPIYIRTAEAVYNSVNDKKDFHKLDSTRHYGPMVFYLCWSKQIDEFIIHQILSRNLPRAVDAIKLYQKINQDFSFSVTEDDLATVEQFAKTAAKKGEKINMALAKIK